MNYLVVYIDLIFLTNLLIDGALIWLTGWMRKINTPWWRMMLSALVGALYVMMMFMPQLSFMYTFLIKFLLSLMMLWIAFGFGSLQNFIRNLGAFYIINFAAAGGIIGVHYLLQSSSELFNGIWFTTSGGLSFELKVGFWFTFIVFFVILFLFKAVQSSRQKLVNRQVYLAEVQVTLGEHIIKCTGLLDTGNQLSDPLSRLPVMVMEASLWENYLPASWKGRLHEEPDKLVMELHDENYPFAERLRLVPFRGVNRDSAFMLAIRPDTAEIYLDGKRYVSKKLLIGLDGGHLSSDKAYQAIIHPDLVQEEASAAVEPECAQSPITAAK